MLIIIGELHHFLGAPLKFRYPRLSRMSSLYVTEPPTDGKVILHTAKGEIEIELWSKEAPKACRNFVALALEGYYDSCVWHRIVPNFIIQTGDPSSTGHGGESFFGAPFENEIHQRLRFNRRGLVAMANAGEKCTNESQFFVSFRTWDLTQHLDYARRYTRAPKQVHNIWSRCWINNIQCPVVG